MNIILLLFWRFNLVSMENFLQKNSIREDFIKAFDHGVKLRTVGACKYPHPMIIYLNKTDSSKIYMPRAAILHRCNDMFGCCQNAAKVCVPVQMQTVELHFIAIQFTVHNSPSNHNRKVTRQVPSVEKILFTNHTLCECRTRNSIPDPDLLDRENEIID